MLAVILAMLFCVVIGAGVVGYVMIEARREGRGDFWTAEGEELIAGARRTTGKVVARSEEIGRHAAERTRNLAPRRPDSAQQPPRSEQPGRHAVGTRGGGRAPADQAPSDRPGSQTDAGDNDPQGPGYRAAS